MAGINGVKGANNINFGAFSNQYIQGTGFKVSEVARLWTNSMKPSEAQTASAAQSNEQQTQLLAGTKYKGLGENIDIGG